jgi:hypothetical protein
MTMMIPPVCSCQTGLQQVPELVLDYIRLIFNKVLMP